MAGEAAGRSRKSAGSRLWWQGAACGLVLAFATPAALLGGALLAPALLALAADAEAGRPMARCVLLFGGAVALGPLWHLCLSGDTMATALDIMSDPTTLAFAWMAAAFGWALCEVLPVVLDQAGKYAEAARVAAWTAELKALEEEWLE